MNPLDDLVGELEVDWSATTGWTEFNDFTVPWAAGPGTMTLTSWVACGTKGQRLAKPDGLDQLTVTFDPPSLARVTNVSLEDDPLWHRKVFVRVETLAIGDGTVTAVGSFEGRTVRKQLPFRVRRFEDVLVSEAILGAAPGSSPATLQGGLWSTVAPASSAHEPLIVQSDVPLPWLRADGRLEVVRMPYPTPSPIMPTIADVTWPKLGPTPVAFSFEHTATVEVVPTSSIALANITDAKGNPIREATCAAKSSLSLKVALSDGTGRSVTGGGALVRSFDLETARPFAEGDGVLVQCLAPGETTLEIVAGQRLSVGLIVTP